MLEELREIDTIAIEKLVKIKKEQERLVGFRSKAEEMKGTVDDAVYLRVLADYESRDSALENEAKPLKAEARGQYEKLCSIYDRIKETLEQTRATKTELEFRHAVGELDKKQLAEKLSGPEGILEQCQSQLGEADKLKTQFQAAFHSTEELEHAPQAALEIDSKGKPEVKREVLSKAKPEADVKFARGALSKARSKLASKVKSEAKPEIQAKVEAKTELESPPEVAPKVEPEGRSVAQPEAKPKVEPKALVAAPDSPASVSSTDKTFIRPMSEAQDEVFAVPQAKLAILKKGKVLDEYSLGVMNYIGRAQENDIRIKSPTVSRKHALVSAEATDFTLKDLGSLSGTFVNDKKISECTLAEGDRIKVGDVELVFRRL